MEFGRTRAMAAKAPAKYGERFSKKVRVVWFVGCEENLVDVTVKVTVIGVSAQMRVQVR